MKYIWLRTRTMSDTASNTRSCPLHSVSKAILGHSPACPMRFTDNYITYLQRIPGAALGSWCRMDKAQRQLQLSTVSSLIPNLAINRIGLLWYGFLRLVPFPSFL